MSIVYDIKLYPEIVINTNKLVILGKYLPRVLVQLTEEYLIDYNFPDYICVGNHIQYIDPLVQNTLRLAPELFSYKPRTGIINNISISGKNLIVYDDRLSTVITIEEPYNRNITYCQCPANTHN